VSARAWYRATRELGLDPRRLRLLGQLPRYLRDLRAWRRRGGAVSTLHPVLGDRADQAGNTRDVYFLQDLLVAQRIHRQQPLRHIDVGSRVDGFVAHLAAFREVEVMDIRPLDARISNIRFLQADLASGAPAVLTDSLSCLHALEHFGLGRYGDRIDPQGHLRGFRSLVEMLATDGTLYLSFPIGRPAVEFNAHRVFSPLEVLDWPGSERLALVGFDLIDDAGELHEQVPLAGIAERCRELVQGCGIYTFRKLAAPGLRPLR